MEEHKPYLEMLEYMKEDGESLRSGGKQEVTSII